MGNIKVVSKRTTSAKICTGKHWKTEQSATSPVESQSQDYVTNNCIRDEQKRHTKKGEKGLFWDQATLNAQHTKHQLMEVTEWYENEHFFPLQ